MNKVKIAAKCLRSWPDAYHMGAHDRNVCKVAADALDEIEQSRRNKEDTTMRVMVLIEEVATRERRWYDAGEDHEALEFMWEDGNYSCDCNRALFFARAGSEPDLDIDCSDELYDVIVILREDGRLYNVER